MLSAWFPADAATTKSRTERDTRIREAVAHIASSFRSQHRARLSRALLRWACAAISLAAEDARYDGFVAVGVVIRGETYHFEIVAGESARGIMALTMDGIAIGNGILTPETMAQAVVRADPDDMDKGGGAAAACLHLVALARRFAG